MKKISAGAPLAAAFFALLIFATAACAELPKNYKEFKARYQKEAKSPEGAVKLYFEGVFVFMNKETRDEGAKMIRYSLRSEVPIERSTYYSTFVERMKDPDYNYVFRSFAVGATPENDYKMSPEKFKINFAGKAVKDPGGFLRLPLKSSGADSLRYVWVKKFEEDGLWFVINNASTYSQVREPKSETVRRSHAFDADYDDPEDEPKPETEAPLASEPVSIDLPPESINPAPSNNNNNSDEEPEEWD